MYLRIDPTVSVVGVMLGLAFASAGRADDKFDWPQFRGPDRDGISKETNWNPKALEGGAKTLWKFNVGEGWSSVSISGNKVFAMGWKDDQDTVYALDAKNGKELWKHSYPCKKFDYPGPRATPVTDGKVVYSLSHDGDLLCLGVDEGKVLWTTNILSGFGMANPHWHLAGSPVIQGDLLVINAGEYGLALNRNTGEKIWASGGGTGGYATPVVFKNGGKECVAIFGAKAIYGVELSTGRKLWSTGWETKYDINAADPIFSDGKLFISSGYDRGGALLDIRGDQAKEVWANTTMRNQFSSSVLVNGYLYGIDGNNGKGSLKCIEFATGKEQWSRPLGFGGLIAAGDRLIVLNESGDLFIGKFTPAGFEELSSARNVLDKLCWTAPVLCRGVIYCRNNKGDVVAIDVGK
ncbi:MAG: PQQ-binding-like beta-propeller repeat protein [bacterium]